MENVITRLEQPEWESTVSASEVTVAMARQVRCGRIPTANPTQVIARIQCLLVGGGRYTDERFVAALLR
jgi:hypothetical protein